MKSFYAILTKRVRMCFFFSIFFFKGGRFTYKILRPGFYLWEFLIKDSDAQIDRILLIFPFLLMSVLRFFLEFISHKF